MKTNSSSAWIGFVITTGMTSRYTSNEEENNDAHTHYRNT